MPEHRRGQRDLLVEVVGDRRRGSERRILNLEPARRPWGAWPGTADGWALRRMRTPGGADSPGTAGTRRAGLWRRTGRTSAAPSSPACRTGTVALLPARDAGPGLAAGPH